MKILEVFIEKSPSRGYIFFGLGDDNKMYRWERGPADWILFSDENYSIR